MIRLMERTEVTRWISNPIVRSIEQDDRFEIEIVHGIHTDSVFSHTLSD